ncbi:DUF2975 domain-containing protein [Herbiconiux liangxiaofengii]|uniref:DUF2975 domain-containing protein n=1 Tax=Herbiconiux liangxiaofengii TaxID=3342795 RepID=UPI0035B87847
MSRPLIGALRAMLVLLFAGAVLAQVFTRQLSGAVLVDPAATVVAVLTVLGLVCIEVVLVCVWALVGLAGDARLFATGRHSERWVDIAIGALSVGAALSTVGLVYLLATGAAGSSEGLTVVVLAAAVAAAACALALLVTVMRHLLHAAAELHDELAEVV